MPPSSRGIPWLQSLRRCPRRPPRFARRPIATVSSANRFLRVSDEVQDALATGKPVVALETTIYTHGFPYPENVGLASHLESLVRVNGGVPATIGILDGVAHVGLEPEEVIQLVSTAGSKDTWKISRRDLGFIAGLGLRGQKLNGGTTIAGTMILAHLAGIKIFATGGLGGVHRGGEYSMDVSADLTELGRTPVAVISSGCKSFLDIPRTLEYLETQGVGVGTFADGRDGKVDFPAFFSRDSGIASPQVIQDEADAAAIVYAQSQLPVHSGLLFANPVPENAAMAKSEIDNIIQTAVAEAEQKRIGGSANTPYILKRIRELSNGASVHANRALIEANIVRGTKVAVELAKLERFGGGPPPRLTHGSENRSEVFSVSKRRSNTIHDAELVRPEEATKNVDLLVAGSLASDTICDYAPFDTSSGNVSPIAQTSNPSRIAQAAGGVGRNVATAAHLAGARASLASAVADDIAGSALIDQLNQTGILTSHIRKLRTNQGARTAQYVAVNDRNKELVFAMADMSILDRPELESPEYWEASVRDSKPKWIVVDGNWSPAIMSSILSAAKRYKIPVAFEPVSTAKATRLFHEDNASTSPLSVVPNHVVHLASPNTLELNAMYNSARDAGYFESEQWWRAVDSMSLSSSGSRDKFTAITNPTLVEQGVPQQCIQLLPYIPTLVTKLGPQGCLLTQLLTPGDTRLTDPVFAPHILARNSDGHETIGGIYMRLFAPAAKVQQNEIINVNGIGDTLLGVIMAGLVKGHSIESTIPIAQEAAVLSLKSSEAVSPEVGSINGRFG